MWFFLASSFPPKNVLLHVFNIFQWISWLSKIGALHFHDEFRECMTNSLLACSGSLTNKGLYEQGFNHWIAHVLDQSTPRPVPALQPGVFILATCAFCSFWLLKNLVTFKTFHLDRGCCPWILPQYHTAGTGPGRAGGTPSPCKAPWQIRDHKTTDLL